MNNSEILEIEVINWDLYNPRSSTKKPTWFRFENTIATGPGFFGLDCEQKWLWATILSLVSQSNGDRLPWNSAYIKSITGIDEKKQIETLEIFEKFVRLRISRKVSEPDRCPTNERTNERTIEFSRKIEEPRHKKSELDDLIEIWSQSLSARGLKKNAKWDEVAITRLNLRHGFEKTALALEGARFEPDSEKFKATAHMTVQRLLEKPAFFESSVNRALENKPVERKTAKVEIT